MEKNSRVEVGKTPSIYSGKPSNRIRGGEADNMLVDDGGFFDNEETISKVATVKSFGQDKRLI